MMNIFKRLRLAASLFSLSVLAVGCSLPNGNFSFSFPPPPAVEITDLEMQDFAFLTGYWVGEGLGGNSEEMWTPPTAAGMFGVFKQSSESGLMFTELMEITEVEGAFLLRLKHFDADFNGWEARDEYITFPLISASPGKLDFEGLSYELVDRDRLEISVQIGQADGTVETEKFSLSRIDQ